MQDVADEEETSKTESERGMSPTMSLVIGIIIGSFTAMFLIVIIVLKVKTGVDISEIKQVRFLTIEIYRGFICFKTRRRCRDISFPVPPFLKKTTFPIMLMPAPVLSMTTRAPSPASLT